MAEMTSGGVSTSACRRRGWTSRDSGAARVSSRKVKRKRRDRSSTWDDVPLGERVEGSPSRRPVRVRDAVQVALDARQERRGVRGVAHRARPARRAIPIYRTDECARSENDFCDARRRALMTARQRRFRVSERGRRFQKRAKSVGAARPHGGPTSRRAEHARTDRGAREASAVRTAEGTASVGGVAVFRVWRNGRRDEVGGRDVRFGRGR